MGSKMIKKNFKRKLLAVAVVSCFGSQAALAAPTGATVVKGSASIATSGSTMTVTNTPNAIINWASFGIAAGETVRFVQQSAASAVLNRVTGSNPSHILGALQSNGKVFLINPNGIMFGAGAQINVNGLIASTLNLSDADFLAGRMNFNADRANPGSVVNAGNIQTPTGGFVYLLAPNVENSGVITTPSGEAILAAGNSVEIINSTDPSQRVLVSAISQDVNLSTLMTQSGGNIFSVLNSGKVSANTVVQDATGKIYFKSAGNVQTTSTSLVEVKGDIDASGGSFIGFADQNGIYAGSFDASGKNGGFIETSGHFLNVDGIHVDAAAIDGAAGTWLLDPVDVTIIHATSATDTNMYAGSGIYYPNSDATSIISDFTLNQAINGGTSVILQTLSTGTSSNGDIIFSDGVVLAKSVGATFGTTLTLSAYRDIVFSGSSSIINNSPTQGFLVRLDAGTGGTGGINILSGGSLTVNGAGAYPDATLMDVQVMNGKVWTNNGSLTLTGRGQIDLSDGTAATFINNGVVNITNNTSGWAFHSTSGVDDGIINNNGSINVNGSTAFEALFNNSGFVNVAGGGLNLQNANILSGTFVINSGASLNLTETHSGIKKFDGATIIKDGALGFGVAGTINNSSIISSGDLTVPTTNITYTGYNSFIAGGGLTLSGALNASTADFLMAAKGNVTISGGSDFVSSLFVYAGGDAIINNANIYGTYDVDINAGGAISVTNSYISADFVGLHSIGDPESVTSYLDSIVADPTITDIYALFALMQSKGDVTLDNSSINGSSIDLVGNNVNVTGSSIYAYDDLFVMAQQDFNISNMSYVSADNEMVAIAGNAINLTDSSSIRVNSPDTLYFGFPTQATGMWFVDGVQGAFGAYPGSGSYIMVDDGIPILGVNFFVFYGGLSVIKSTLPYMDPIIPEFYDPAVYTEADFFGTDDGENEEDQPQQCSA